MITLFEAGLTNVVAPQGTAFTEGQARILKRYVSEVVLCFDADAAGQKAAERSLEPLLENNLIVRVAEMPPGEDPDSLVRKEGAEKFSARIAAARDFFDFWIERQAAATGPDELERQDADRPAVGRNRCARARLAHAERSDQQSCRASRRERRTISPLSCRKRRGSEPRRRHRERPRPHLVMRSPCFASLRCAMRVRVPTCRDRIGPR